MTRADDLDLDKTVQDIALRVRLTGWFVLAIVLVLLCAFFLMVAEDGLRDFRGLSSAFCGVLICFAAAGFFQVLERDFRERKWWTFDIVEYLTWNFLFYPKRLRVAMRDPRMMAAFGFDEYSVPAESNSGTDENKGGHGGHNS